MRQELVLQRYDRDFSCALQGETPVTKLEERDELPEKSSHSCMLLNRRRAELHVRRAYITAV